MYGQKYQKELQIVKLKIIQFFAQSDRLFSFFEYYGEGFEEDTKIMRDNSKFQEWEKVHEQMFMPLANKT